MLWGWPINSSVLKPLTWMKAALQWVMRPAWSVVDMSNSLSGTTNSSSRKASMGGAQCCAVLV